MKVCVKKVILILLAVAAAWAYGDDPYVGYIYPCGIQAGMTNRLVVGGQGLGGVRDVVVSGEGVTVLSIEAVPNFPPAPGSQFRYLAKWLDAFARPARMRPFPERPRNNRAYKKAAIPASAGDIEAHCQRAALDAAFVCAVGAGKSAKGAECRPGGRVDEGL